MAENMVRVVAAGIATPKRRKTEGKHKTHTRTHTRRRNLFKKKRE